ncbi:5623_t:CDS:2 [Funneliformis geosporum]|nr:5623_t:CDS:2 [Funneliformis geosporum]
MLKYEDILGDEIMEFSDHSLIPLDIEDIEVEEFELTLILIFIAVIQKVLVKF